jgi:hypothetical protein
MLAWRHTRKGIIAVMIDREELRPPSDFFLRLENFVPSLRQAIECEPLDLKKVLRAAVPAEKTDGGEFRIPATMDRRAINLTDGKNACLWETDSLRALFRGNAQPPVLGDHPKAGFNRDNRSGSPGWCPRR